MSSEVLNKIIECTKIYFYVGADRVKERGKGAVRRGGTEAGGEEGNTEREGAVEKRKGMQMGDWDLFQALYCTKHVPLYTVVVPFNIGQDFLPHMIYVPPKENIKRCNCTNNQWSTTKYRKERKDIKLGCSCLLWLNLILQSRIIFD